MGNIVNPDKRDSFSNSLRRKRFALFLKLVNEKKEKKPISILDVGGTEIFWENMGFGVSSDTTDWIQITLLNLEKNEVRHPNFRSVAGDARSMPEFKNGEFDIVFSNSVIEHVGDFEDQRRMADEIKRVAKRYYVQTPNYHFPIEPHFLFPFFQFLPVSVRASLINKFNLGNTRRIEAKDRAVAYVKNLQLLSHSKLKKLFPEATIHREKFLGLTKSFVCIK
jgi:hypothetical protein